MDYSLLEPMRFRMTAKPEDVAIWFATAPVEKRLVVITRHLRAVPVSTLKDRWIVVTSQFSPDEVEALMSEWGASRRAEYSG